MSKQRFGPGKLADYVGYLPDSGKESATELLIVEGDSAAEAVKTVRDSSFQAVLPMQGKPLNAAKASAAALKRHELFCSLVAALGYPDALQNVSSRKPLDLTQLRYHRVVLLFDPDADGIHCAALMVLFFHKVLPELLEDGRIEIVRAPLYCFRFSEPNVAPDTSSSQGTRRPSGICQPSPMFAYSDTECRRLENELATKNVQFDRHYFRGLGGIPREILSHECVSPTSRKADRIGTAEAEAMRAILGAG